MNDICMCIGTPKHCLRLNRLAAGDFLFCLTTCLFSNGSCFLSRALIQTRLEPKRCPIFIPICQYIQGIWNIKALARRPMLAPFQDRASSTSCWPQAPLPCRSVLILGRDPPAHCGHQRGISRAI